MTLIDVCERIVDCPHSTANDEGEGYPLIRTPNIGKGRLLLDGVHRVSKEVYDLRNARAVPRAGDLILAREAPAGNVALITEGQEVCLGQRTVLIQPNHDLVDAAFLTYYLLAPKSQHELLSSANGATVAHVNMPRIRGLKIHLPSREEQERIARVLSEYDDLIANNTKQILLLEELAQRLFKQWFVEFRFPGSESVSWVDGIPAGWEMRRIIDNPHFSFAKCRLYPFENDMIYYATADVDGTYLVANGERITYPDKPSRAQIKPSQNSVWFARMSNSYKILGFVNNNEARRQASVLSSGFAGFETSYDKFAYMYCLVASRWFDDQKNRYATGSTQVSITNEGLSKIMALVPPEDLVIKFSKVSNSVIETVTALRESNMKLSEARDKILPRLINS